MGVCVCATDWIQWTIFCYLLQRGCCVPNSIPYETIFSFPMRLHRKPYSFQIQTMKRETRCTNTTNKRYDLTEWREKKVIDSLCTFRVFGSYRIGGIVGYSTQCPNPYHIQSQNRHIKRQRYIEQRKRKKRERRRKNETRGTRRNTAGEIHAIFLLYAKLPDWLYTQFYILPYIHTFSHFTYFYFVYTIYYIIIFYILLLSSSIFFFCSSLLFRNVCDSRAVYISGTGGCFSAFTKREKNTKPS